MPRPALLLICVTFVGLSIAAIVAAQHPAGTGSPATPVGRYGMREKFPHGQADPTDRVVRLGAPLSGQQSTPGLRVLPPVDPQQEATATSIPAAVPNQGNVSLTAGWSANNGSRSVSKPRLGEGSGGSGGGLLDLLNSGENIFARPESDPRHRHHHGENAGPDRSHNAATRNSARPTPARQGLSTAPRSARAYGSALVKEPAPASTSSRSSHVHRHRQPPSATKPTYSASRHTDAGLENNPPGYQSDGSPRRATLQDKLSELRRSLTPETSRREPHRAFGVTESVKRDFVKSDEPDLVPDDSRGKPLAESEEDSAQSSLATSRRRRPRMDDDTAVEGDVHPRGSEAPTVRMAQREPTAATRSQGENDPLAAGDQADDGTPGHLPQADVNVARQLDSASRKGTSPDVLLALEGPQLTAQATGPRKIVVSREADFTVTVRNSGDVPASDVVVRVKLPPWVDVSGTSPSRGHAQANREAGGDQPLLWRISRLEPESSETLKLTLIPRRSQPLDLAVQWTYAHAGSNTRVEVEEPLLQMVISGPSEAVYGETKLYNLTISNPGTGDAENVQVSLLPLDGKDEAVASSSLGTIRHGETKTIQIELAAGKAGTLLVKARAVADGGLAADASKEVLIRRAQLEVSTIAPEAQYAGNMAHYRLQIVNTGNATAEEVSVTAVMPPGASFADSSDNGHWLQKQGRVRWDIGALAAGQERELKLSCILSTPGDNRLRAAAQDNTDLMAVHNVVTRVIARADLKLQVSDPQGPVPVGDEAEYEVRIRNRGTEKATSIEAVIFFSDGIEPEAVEGPESEIGRGQVVFETIDELAAGDEITLKVKARAQRPGSHIFRVEVLCRSLGTKLAAEETTHFYGKNISPTTKQPAPSVAARPTRRGPAPAVIQAPSPLAPGKEDPAPTLAE